MRGIITLWAALASLVSLAFPVEIEGDSIYSALLNRHVRYSVIIPSGFDPAQPHRVMYMLHGTDADCTDWLEYGNAAATMDRMAAQGLIDQIVMVMPDGYLSYYSDAYDGSFPYESFFVNELMPAIQQRYAVPDDPAYRSIMGYSMGAFGAVAIGVRNPGKFSTVYSLSLSLRTDEQYMTEGPQDAWNAQWGHTFGAVDSIGPARLTPWYKAHAPHQLLEATDKETLKGINLVFEIGDKERRLARGNEMVHRMLLERGIPHRWITRDGGHTFNFWRSALPNALLTVSPASPQSPKEAGLTVTPVKPRLAADGGELFLPLQDPRSNRRYAVIYLRGFDGDRRTLADAMMAANDSLGLQPVAIGFLDPCDDINSAVARIERSCPRVRTTQRLRAFIDLNADISATLASVAADNLFTAIALISPKGAIGSARPFVDAVAAHRRSPLVWMWTGSDDPSYALPSEIHLLMRDRDLKHEFRVAPADEAASPIPDLVDVVNYLSARIHI